VELTELELVVGVVEELLDDELVVVVTLGGGDEMKKYAAPATTIRISRIKTTKTRLIALRRNLKSYSLKASRIRLSLFPNLRQVIRCPSRRSSWPPDGNNVNPGSHFGPLVADCLIRLGNGPPGATFMVTMPPSWRLKDA